MNNIIEVKCPKCGSKDYECYDTSHRGDGTCVEYCYCEECDAQFDVKYIAVEIK